MFRRLHQMDWQRLGGNAAKIRRWLLLVYLSAIIPAMATTARAQDELRK